MDYSILQQINKKLDEINDRLKYLEQAIGCGRIHPIQVPKPRTPPSLIPPFDRAPDFITRPPNQHPNLRYKHPLYPSTFGDATFNEESESMVVGDTLKGRRVIDAEQHGIGEPLVKVNPGW